MKIFSIKELNSKAGSALRDSFEHTIMIKGEITKAKKYPNGNQYCTLSENSGLKQYTVDCAILSWESTQKIDITDYDNSEVLITGKVDFYEAAGRFQIKILEIDEYGEGALRKKIERLRKKLGNEGMFERKREIPNFPKIIGVITSQQGDVLHDVTTIIKKRYPIAEVYLYPSSVQGELAARSIIKQIKLANVDDKADVLLIVRGGGSFQDLMPFNDEALAREIYSSEIPTITGIGHQPDITIADYVSDFHAETPTHAATKATKDKNEIFYRIAEIEKNLFSQVKFKLKECQTLIKENILKIESYKPQKIIENMSFQYKDLISKLTSFTQIMLKNIKNDNKTTSSQLKNISKNIKHEIRNSSENLTGVHKQLNFVVWRAYKEKKQELSGLIAQTTNCNPKKILKKGYSIIKNNRGRIIKSKIEFDKVLAFSAEFHDGESLVKKR